MRIEGAESAAVASGSMSWIERGVLVGLVVGVAVMGFMATSVQAQSSELTTAIDAAADDILATVLAVLPGILAVAAVLLTIPIAWKYLKRFAK